MGMGSYVVNYDIEMLDFEGFKKMVHGFAELRREKEFWIKFIDEEKKTLNVDNFDDLKMISYWYTDMLIFIKLLSKFIEGNIELNSEDGDLATIYFGDKDVNISIGHLEWTDYSVDELKHRPDEEELEKFAMLYEI